MDNKTGPGALLPLALATIDAYTAATGKKTTDLEMLNKVVWPNEVQEGKMQLGGEALRFPDGRPVLENLSIHRDDFALAVAEVLKLYEQRRI
jgi:hypothetical protein